MGNCTAGNQIKIWEMLLVKSKTCSAEKKLKNAAQNEIISDIHVNIK